MIYAAFFATTLAALFGYLSSPHQRWLVGPLPSMPARISAALAAIVALRAWIEVLPLASALLAWLTTLMLASMLAVASGALRKL